MSLDAIDRPLPVSYRFQPPAGQALPGELDLELTLVVTDLNLELELHFIGHVHGEALSASCELHLVVTCECVGEGMQPCGGLLAADGSSSLISIRSMTAPG